MALIMVKVEVSFIGGFKVAAPTAESESLNQNIAHFVMCEPIFLVGWIYFVSASPLCGMLLPYGSNVGAAVSPVSVRTGGCVR